MVAAAALDAHAKADVLLMAGAVLAMRARRHVRELLNYTLSAGVAHNISNSFLLMLDQGQRD